LYHQVATDQTHRLQLRDGKLAVESFELVATSPNTLEDTRGRVKVRASEPNGAIHLRIEPRNDMPFEIVKVEEVKPTDAQLQEFAGSYTSPELGVNYQISAGNSGLVVKRRLQSDLTLTPAFKDAFGNFGTWVFTRDAGGKVNGLLYTQGRVRRLRFVKD
jgi:hypothetical protein